MSKNKALNRHAATTVTLVVPQYDMSREFGILHAERLLSLGESENGGWRLPENSTFEFDKENGLRRKASKPDNTATEA